ncbi:MAG: hypothetical protein JSS49_24185 [Planctomycetes bacterium]|nr:hypothetical protein [Planctomycetota bacterium]
MTDNAALFLMVETGDVAGVRAWLSQGGDPNSPQEKDGSLLHYGVRSRHQPNQSLWQIAPHAIR